jgi:hypothetical protein
MTNRLFGRTDTLRFEVHPKEPEGFSVQRVDIHALHLHITENDNSVYVPNFLFRLDRALLSFDKNTRFEPRPDVFGELGPAEIHRIFMDGSDDYPDPMDFSSLYEFLQFGDITLHVASFLIPVQGRVYLTCESGGQPDDGTTREVRVSEVTVEELRESMADTLELVAGEYDGDKSSLSWRRV